MKNRPFKVILVNPPPFQILEPEYDTPPSGRQGLAYVAGYLRRLEGYSVEIIDAKFERINFEETLQRILEKEPDVVGFGAFTCEIKPAAYLARQLKTLEPEIITVVGGVHVTAIPEQTLREFPAFDIGVHGEGEVTFAELCEALKDEKKLDFIPGLVFRDGEKIRMNAPRERIADQDTIPFPAWDLLPPAREYFVMSQRGCPFNCLFCMNPNGRAARPRSIANVMEELEWIVREFKPKRIRFGDELFSVNMDRTHELLDAMIAAGMPEKFDWHAQTHVHFVDGPLFKKMKKANVWLIGMGVETGDADILKQMGKGTSPDMILRAAQAAKEAKVPIITYLILGHPNETLESMKKTIDLAVKINPAIPAFGIMVPYPGTEVARMAAEGKGGYRLRSTNWDDYDKQIGGALEFANLSRTQIEKLQMMGYFKVFLSNHRYWDLVKFCWRFRKEGFSLVRKILSGRSDKLSSPKSAASSEGPALEKWEIAEATGKWQDWQRSELVRIKKIPGAQSQVVFAENQRA